MLDFLMISYRSTKKDTIEIYPKFVIKKCTDLMIRGGDFYAIWVEETGLWSTDEDDVTRLIDAELDIYAKANASKFDGSVRVLHMWDAESGMIDKWHKYCQKQMRDSFTMLDEKLIFSNAKTTKKDYASKRLPYPLEAGEHKAFDKLMNTLYLPEEKEKIEWAIGAIVNGDSKYIQKFMVLYGSAGTGKSTILNIIQQLFDGYYSVFDAKALGSASNSFALESFKTNPLVAIQHDGDLSKIEDNTRLNSLVSHELMTVNEKFRTAYSNSFKSFLFMGTNKPVKITDGRSGLIRRLIDVSPSGEKVTQSEYDILMRQIKFELGSIAYHCKDVYESDVDKYSSYVPVKMLGASNDFYNFVIDSYRVFKEEDGTTLTSAWEMYKTYCDDAKVSFPFSKRVFKEELRNYFKEYKDRFNFDNGNRVRSYYSGFRYDKFEDDTEEIEDIKASWITFEGISSNFDILASSYNAQYASSKGTPLKKWDDVTTILSKLDTSKLHYVKIPDNHIVVDFDITDESGNKSLEKNLEAASKFPETYAELSKSGQGIHLHYIYDGDVTKLSRVFDEHIEVKIFNGNSSLRRKLTKCNELGIAKINSGLPLKEVGKVVGSDVILNEKSLRTMIKKNLNKEYHPGTKPSIDFIHHLLEQAYESEVKYDVSDMYNAVLAFAIQSTNQAKGCIKIVDTMKFKSEDASPHIESVSLDLVFFDIEVFPNLFVVCWKKDGADKQVHTMINPTSRDIEILLQYRLIGFNCRKYDNHLIYARLMGYSNEKLYQLSKKIISGDKGVFFGEAYNLSYTDIYDFSSKKQSLKKFEIDLGIHHQELGLDWDTPVEEALWDKVGEYCINDVIATEATFHARKSDFLARQILADIAGMSVNDTTNSLSTRIIFGGNKNPQSEFNYRDMGDVDAIDFSTGYEQFDDKGRPLYPGYQYSFGKSTYRDEEIGEGGYVYSEPGIHVNVALLDIASMHPSSIVAEELFGPKYTKRFKDILDARIAIKHKEFDVAREMMGGVLRKYLDDESAAGDLATALKIVINSIYGLTSAKFINPFRDSRNVDNIVAKRGALFMVNLKHFVQERGFTVAHIKTDSIKIPNATPEIIQAVYDYGQQYGYTFEHEATYEKMCLVNDAVYIAQYKDGKHASEWTATGTQFAVPYVFKTLFSKEPIEFSDLCETKSVSKGRIFIDMNEHLEDVYFYEKLRDIRETYKKDPTKLTKKDTYTYHEYEYYSNEALEAEIAKGHNYIFIGKVGSFCPIKDICGGGVLYRENEGKYYAVTGTKGYRWLESEVVENLGKQDDIDRSYYEKMVDDAVTVISQYGDIEWFTN